MILTNLRTVLKDLDHWEQSQDISRTSSGALCLGESPVHHGVARDVVALVGLDQEVQPDIVEPREEVESVPGALSGRLLAGADLSENISYYKIFDKS